MAPRARMSPLRRFAGRLPGIGPEGPERGNQACSQRIHSLRLGLMPAPDSRSPETPPPEEGHGPEEGELSLSLILECRTVNRGPLRIPSWSLSALIAGGPGGEIARGRRVRREEGREEFLWTGFSLPLSPGSAESYWFNLIGESPSLFVICRPEADPGLAPVAITADHDLATAHLEADDTVFSAPIPPEIVPRLERFVMDHHRPAPPSGGKRRDRDKGTAGDG